MRGEERQPLQEFSQQRPCLHSASKAKYMAKKYHSKNLMPALRLFVEARNKAVESGFTDNGGAIHSVERILDILSMHICYPHLSHINSLKSDPAAEISVAA